jgi:hypothetical protein
MGQHLRLHCHKIGCSSARTGISRNGADAFIHNERNAYTSLGTLRMIRVLLDTLQYLPMSDRFDFNEQQLQKARHLGKIGQSHCLLCPALLLSSAALASISRTLVGGAPPKRPPLLLAGCKQTRQHDHKHSGGSLFTEPKERHSSTGRVASRV